MPGASSPEHRTFKNLSANAVKITVSVGEQFSGLGIKSFLSQGIFANKTQPLNLLPSKLNAYLTRCAPVHSHCIALTQQPQISSLGSILSVALSLLHRPWSNLQVPVSRRLAACVAVRGCMTSSSCRFSDIVIRPGRCGKVRGGAGGDTPVRHFPPTQHTLPSWTILALSYSLLAVQPVWIAMQVY